MKIIFVSIAALLVMTIGAVAQVPDTTVDVFGFAMPYVQELIALVIMAIVGYVVNLVRQWTGINIEAKHRDALQSALNNGANKLLGKVVPDGKGAVRIDVGSQTIKDAVDYVLNSVPDAAKHFGLTPADVRKLLEPKILAMVAADPTVKEVSAGQAVDVKKT